MKLQTLVAGYLNATLYSFLLEDVLALGLSSWRFWRVCTLTGITLHNWTQKFMTVQLMFSMLMVGFQLANMKEKLRIRGLVLRQQTKLAAVVENATTGECPLSSPYSPPPHSSQQKPMRTQIWTSSTW